MASRVNPPKETGVAMSIILLAPNVVSARLGRTASTSVPVRPIAARGRRVCLRPRPACRRWAGSPAIRLLRKRKRHGHSPDHQLSIDVDGTAAHALHHAGRPQRPAGQPRQDERFLRPYILQNAQKFPTWKSSTRSPENTVFANTVHAGFNVLEREKIGGRVSPVQRQRQRTHVQDCSPA